MMPNGTNAFTIANNAPRVLHLAPQRMQSTYQHSPNVLSPTTVLCVLISCRCRVIPIKKSAPHANGLIVNRRIIIMIIAAYIDIIQIPANWSARSTERTWSEYYRWSTDNVIGIFSCKTICPNSPNSPNERINSKRVATMLDAAVVVVVFIRDIFHLII